MNEKPETIERYDWVTIKKNGKDGAVVDVRIHSDGTKEFFVKYFRGKGWFKESEVTLLNKH